MKKIPGEPEIKVKSPGHFETLLICFRMQPDRGTVGSESHLSLHFVSDAASGVPAAAGVDVRLLGLGGVASYTLLSLIFDL